MRRIALGLAIAVVVCLTARAHGQDIYDCYNGSAEQGGNRITANGIQSLQYVQQSFPNAQVDVYLHNTTTHATIFQDAAGTVPLANPFTASAHGVAFVCAADGRYDFKYSLGGITVPFTVSDIKFCFNCSGGGGGTVGPGTVNQIAKFSTTSNVGDSSGGPDDGVHVVPWTNGLSIENSPLDKSRPNGTNCTTTNLLVEYDGNTISNVATVQTASLSSQKVIGVADQGAGCSGNVRIADHGFHACIFDNQTTIHDAVIASASVAGECSDGGGSVQGTQVVGRVASVNTGPGTVATVDWFTGDTQQATGSITSCATGGSNAYYPGIGQIISCDPLILDDGNGGLTFNNAAFSGFWYQKQGTLLAQAAMKANSFYFSAGPTVSASYGLQPPSAIPTAGNCAQFSAGDATGYIKITDAGAPCGTGSGTTIQTEGTPNASQTLINFTHSSNNFLGTVVQNVNPSGGIERPDFTIPQVSTPAQPTATVGGTPGAATVTWEVVACQDSNGTCTYHTAPSATVTVTTANATLSSSPVTLTVAPSAQVRCYDWYRTVGGPSQGKIISCGGTAVIDNGLAASGSAPSTNTTQLVARLDGYGCNVHPDAPKGSVDALPCSPTPTDDEFTHTFGAPADANDGQWAWVNQNSASAVWTNGVMAFSVPTRGATINLNCLVENVAAGTSYTYEMYAIENPGATAVNHFIALALYESGTGKFTLAANNNGSSSGSGGFFWYAANYTNTTTPGTNLYVGSANEVDNGTYYRLSRSGSTLTYQASTDGISYATLATQTITTPFTTAPDKVGVCGMGYVGAGTWDIDFIRRIN